jgi:Ca2+/Na+ antiporter
MDLSLFLLAAALASVTKNIPQMLRGALFIVLYVIGTSALFSILRKSNLSGSIDFWAVLLQASTAVGIILIQYSRRRTALSLWLIVGVCAFLTLMSVATPVVVPDRKQIAREYPLSSGALPVELALAHFEQRDGNFTPIYNGQVSLQLP